MVADDVIARATAHRLAMVSDARPPTPAPPPSKLTNLKRALHRWQKSGFQMTPGRERRTRSAICAVCPHWNGSGNLGLGECRAPGCGCTRAKVWLATEACPLGKWGAV